MRQAVRDNYTAFTSRFEGAVPWMYLDVKGLVTTGIGNLIDSVGAAQALPWRHGQGGPLASQDEIAQAWSTVKGMQGSKMLGGGNKVFQNASDLRLDADGIRKLVNDKLNSNEAILLTRFPGFEAWPADAQLGLLSMAWAMGPYFKFPKFEAAVNQLVPDFKAAAALSHMNAAGNPGLVPRNTANEALFNAAADVLKNNLDLATIQWDGFEDLLSKGTAALSSGLKSGVAAAQAAGKVVQKQSKLFAGAAVLVGAAGAFAIYKGVKG